MLSDLGLVTPLTLKLEAIISLGRGSKLGTTCETAAETEELFTTLCFLKPERSILEELMDNWNLRTRKHAVSCPCLKPFRASPAPAPESGVHASLL